MSATAIYDFEGVLEGATVASLTAAGITAFSSQDDQVQQKERPYVAVSVALGAGNQQFLQVDPATGLPPAEPHWKYRRERSWDVTVTLCLITNPTIAEHTAARCKLRNVMASLWLTINGTAPMTRHQFEWKRDGGSTALQMSQDRDHYRTDFTFYGIISVQADAWTALTEP